MNLQKIYAYKNNNNIKKNVNFIKGEIAKLKISGTLKKVLYET